MIYCVAAIISILGIIVVSCRSCFIKNQTIENTNKWTKFTDQKPDRNSIIFINSKNPNCDKWINGFCYYQDGTFNNEYIEANGYWVYAEGLNINISHPEDKQ